MNEKLRGEEQKNMWLIWDFERELPFTYSTRKEAEKDLRIFNKERCTWQVKNYLFKQV
jgi:hypothetical protein